MITLIDKYSKEIVSKLGDNLESLILVGSYSRGEEIEGLSDVEFLGVVKNVRDVGIVQNIREVTVNFTSKKHLKRLKPYIFTLELKKFGKVVFGDTNILNIVPDYDYKDIATIDGFILLNNRLVEQLILLNKIEDGQTINQYDFDKGYIQLVNSILVLKRQYKSLYPEKQEAFTNIYQDKGLLSKTELAFASLEELSKKLIGKDEALKKWLELREYFRKIFLDEQKILGNLKCWVEVLGSGRPIRVFIYRKAASLYFSDKYLNRVSRDHVIGMWEKFVK